MRRHKNVVLGKLSGHFDNFHSLLLFFFQENFQKNTKDFEAAIDLKASKWTKKAVNSHPYKLIKACKVTDAQKVVVKSKSSG